jgi:hypothetical protein
MEALMFVPPWILALAALQEADKVVQQNSAIMSSPSSQSPPCFAGLSAECDDMIPACVTLLLRKHVGDAAQQTVRQRHTSSFLRPWLTVQEIDSLRAPPEKKSPP